MRWDRARRSRNVEDRRGASSSGKSKLGAGVLLPVLVLSLFAQYSAIRKTFGVLCS